MFNYIITSIQSTHTHKNTTKTPEYDYLISFYSFKILYLKKKKQTKKQPN